MKKWTDDFLSQCLEGLPKDKYRKRAQDELTDHLLELAGDLESGGYSPEEAQERALELMGSPEELNPAFREEWVRRASNWKYCLVSFLKAGLDAVLVNALARWVVLMPVVLVASMWLFDHLESGSPFPVILFALVNFLPGLWFCARELHERFAIHPQRRFLLFCGLLTAWFMEMLPFFPIPYKSSGPLAVARFLQGIYQLPFFLGQFPMLILTWSTSYTAQSAFNTYCFSTLFLCVFFALFYRPKSDKPFMLSDKT